MINKIVIIGRLTRDPELRTTQSGTSVTNFTVACERDFAGKDGSKETDFIPVIVWKGQAEACEKYLSKGSLVGVEGRLQVRSYEDSKGVKRTIAEIVASSVQFLSSKNDGNSSAYAAEELDEMEPLDDIPF